MGADKMTDAEMLSRLRALWKEGDDHLEPGRKTLREVLGEDGYERLKARWEATPVGVDVPRWMRIAHDAIMAEVGHDYLCWPDVDANQINLAALDAEPDGDEAVWDAAAKEARAILIKYGEDSPRTWRDVERDIDV